MNDLLLWYFRHSLACAQQRENLHTTVSNAFVSVVPPMIKICQRIAGKDGWYELPSGLRLHLVQKIQHINRVDWQHLTKDEGIFLSDSYLEIFEATATPEMRFHYAIAYQDERPVVAMYFQIIHLDNKQLSSILAPLASSKKYVGFAAGWREWLKKGNDQITLQVLISGNNFVSGEHGLAHDPEFPAAQAFTTLSETIKAIVQTDRKNGLISAILVKDYFDRKELPSDQLRRARYHRFLVEPEMIVPILEDWKSFEDYIADMSKKYRNRAKSVMKKSAALQIVEWKVNDIEQHSERMMELYIAVSNRAKFRLANLTAEYFIEMKRRFPDEFRVHGYFLDGKLVGFRSSFLMIRWIEAHFIGIDYSVNEDNCLYQRMLYDYVCEGIADSVKIANVFLGRTAAEIKSTVGAEAHDLVCYIRHRNAFSNQIIRPFIDYLRPSEWIPRSPFKEQSEVE